MSANRPNLEETITMNKTYALVWNPVRRSWAAVGETARRRGKTGSGKRAAVAAVSLLGFAALPAFALPSGESVANGKADISRSNDGRSMSINQHTDKLVTNWQDFSVDHGERVSFHQPGSQSIALNRVLGNQGSQIHGAIDANGKVFLVNPNGVMFGSGAQVNVGGLVASTQNLSDADFLAGRYRFAGTSGASVVNEGTLTAAEGGSVALLGARVSNRGVIQAKLGSVALGAGEAFNVNFDGNGLLNLQVERGAVDAQVNNGGLLKADGGAVLMNARAAGDLLGAVVNNTGVIEARGLSGRGGRITLDGGTVKVGGKLDASAADNGAPVGAVVTRGERVDVAAATRVDTRSGSTAGTWTIEAANAGVNGPNVSGRSIDTDTLSRNLDTTSIELANTQGDLTVGAPVSWTSDNALTLTSRKANVDLRDTLSATGANARLTLNAGDRIRLNNAVKLTGRNAHLELNSRNGHVLANARAVVTLSGPYSSYRANGQDYKVVHTLADLRNIASNMAGNYVLGNAIDGAGANFITIDNGSAFVGVFDGLGNSISRLAISNPNGPNVGLFGSNMGWIGNLALHGIRATSSARNESIGSLVGYNFGTISNVKATDITVTARGVTEAGGLVGANINGRIDGATVAGRLDADRSTYYAGGLVGANRKFSEGGEITDSHANMRVTVARDGATGGLAGYNNGLILNSSSAGSVTGNGPLAMLGGLVGVNDFGGVIRHSSSSSSVTAGSNAVAGGLVGGNAGRIDETQATGTVTVGDISIAGGLVGVNEGEISSSTASGNVSAGALSKAAGLIGSNAGQVANAEAKGNVTAGASSMAGGLIGLNTGLLQNVKASGNVKAGNESLVGGLVAHNKNGLIRNASARGSVTAGYASTAGGLVGLNDGSIEASEAEGAVLVGNDSTAGGLVGINNGRIATSKASGNVSAGNASTAGGLAGLSIGVINASAASGNVTALAASNVGGLVGLNRGNIEGTKASGNVKAGAGSTVGGLVGANEKGNIRSSSASGDVEGGPMSDIGGLVGSLMGSVDNSHASGTVKGSGGHFVGGLVGNNAGFITASSSSGAVHGGRGAWVGGLVGGNFGVVKGSTTSSRVVSTEAGRYGAFAGFNASLLSGNTATGDAAGSPKVAVNIGGGRVED
ncbi:GLUG motif-containing protein [Burkholderia seminalis]|uniref:GLUG motif-containing protein n=1 Tax=Burkholderia seminalis TaxID=488731 RepID=UPI001F4E3F40|nr:GLUG motif-containing protein [Burkholderia seminalis]